MAESVYNRRHFIRTLGAAAAGLASSGVLPSYLYGKGRTFSLTILHTNDTHSRIDPFPKGSALAGQGGVAARMELIRQIRSQQPRTLLLDAGDFFQGTPYFNLYNGEVEVRAMQTLGYDVATLGNHDFDGGMDNLLLQLNRVHLPVVTANYHYHGHGLGLRCQSSVIVRRNPLSIGIFGLGINPVGLIPPALVSGLSYTDPFEAARQQVSWLRRQRRCHLVVCLSHLGLGYADERPSDRRLAREVSGIDLIVGGHTHSFLDQPEVHQNPEGRAVHIVQAGHGGLRLGRLDMDIRLGSTTEAVPAGAHLMKVGQ